MDEGIQSGLRRRPFIRRRSCLASDIHHRLPGNEDIPAQFLKGNINKWLHRHAKAVNEKMKYHSNYAPNQQRHGGKKNLVQHIFILF
jgi:hypothetical protein